MSTDKGTVNTRAMLAATPTATSTGMLLPSAEPADQATPALVVAMAGAPRLSNSLALPASQAFGRCSSLLPSCSFLKSLMLSPCLEKAGLRRGQVGKTVVHRQQDRIGDRLQLLGQVMLVVDIRAHHLGRFGSAGGHHIADPAAVLVAQRA